MECCENQNIFSKNYENICMNCGAIHNHEMVHENVYIDYNMNISNMLEYRKAFRQINNDILLLLLNIFRCYNEAI